MWIMTGLLKRSCLRVGHPSFSVGNISPTYKNYNPNLKNHKIRITGKGDVFYWKSVLKATDLWFLDPAAIGIPATITAYFQRKLKYLGNIN